MKKLATIAFIILSQAACAQFNLLKISTTSLPYDTLAKITYKLDSIENSARESNDSLGQYYNQATTKIQRLISSFQYKQDSLGKLKLPAEKYAKKIDSLNNAQSETVKKVEGKIQSIRQNATEKINSLPLPPELKTKASQITRSFEKLSLASLSSKLNPPIDIKSLDSSIDQLMPSANIDGIPDLLPDGMQDVSKSLHGISDLTKGGIEQADGLQQSVNEITQDAKQVNQLDKLAESQLNKIDQVGELKEELGNAPANLMTSEEEAKKLLLNQAQEIAIDHFAGQHEALKTAMEKISKYKQKYSSISSLSEITKRPPNPMKGKPLIERIVPGLQFQIFQKQGNLLTDFNLYVGYRVDGQLTSGIGWNQRVAYNLDRDEFNPQARVFGPRVFGEFKLAQGFSPRAEIEVMNTWIPSFILYSRADNRTREWVVSGLVGIKKEYKFYKNIKGTSTIMINILHPRNKSPYPDWVNARFGFEFPIKNKGRRVKMSTKE